MDEYKKLLKVRRYSSRLTKVFIKRAMKAGWTPEGILASVRFGARHFKLMGKRD